MGGDVASTCCQRAMPAASGASMFSKACAAVALEAGSSDIANAGEDAAGFGFAGGRIVAGFEAEKGVFEGEMKVGGFEPHGFAELLAGGFAVAGFQ